MRGICRRMCLELGWLLAGVLTWPVKVWLQAYGSTMLRSSQATPSVISNSVGATALRRAGG
ncbi:hypothetical protein BDW60DRAFT_44014 [Aspergillus nidulans var. acristatus]